MARKNLLKGLMEQSQTDGDRDTPTSKPPAPPETGGSPAIRPTKGAVGAVSRSIADLKSRAVVELDPFTIKGAGLTDRLEHDDDEHNALIASIKEYGQQVPVLVRPDPEKDGQYLIVYGRRRVLAHQDLNRPVKAMIRDLDTFEAVMAQGQENSARRNLSFIERCNFARQMVEANYDTKAICDALSTDKAMVSKMKSVTDAVPVEVIEAIGAAPKVGRDRWLEFARLWSEQGLDAEDALDMIPVLPKASNSDNRFNGLLNWLEKRAAGVTGRAPKQTGSKPAKARQVTPLARDDGLVFGKVTRARQKLTIEVAINKADGFDEWLAEHIEEIHRDWAHKRAQSEE